MIGLFRGYQGDHDLLSRRYGFQSCGLRNVFSITVALVAICNLVGGFVQKSVGPQKILFSLLLEKEERREIDIELDPLAHRHMPR
jgi:hypothetical protein